MIDLLSLLAGILYNSWPLGYTLNPRVAHVSLASGLEAVNQPYSWLFVGADVVSSLLLVIICGWLWQTHRARMTGRAAPLALASATLFGIGTIVDALVPERCVPNLMVCPDFTRDHTLLLHGAFSILASIFLFVALLTLWLQQRRSLLLSSILIAYVIFGAISLAQAVLPGRNGNWSQDYYMALCGIWIACLPRALRMTVPLRSAVKQPASSK